MENDSDSGYTIWDPLNIFRCSTDYNHAVVILNRPIQLSFDIVSSLWKKAKVTVAVDGGTNRWINYLGEQRTERLLRGECTEYLPTLVTGDMDSINPKLLQRLEKINATIVRTPDQNYTDYTKALKQLQLYASSNNVHSIDSAFGLQTWLYKNAIKKLVAKEETAPDSRHRRWFMLLINRIFVLVESSGRFDHIIANINTLYKADSLVDGNTEVIQVASNSMTWLLTPGKHKILIPEALIAQKCWCSLIPFGSSTSKVSTTGLKWNLENTCMRFGDLVSTSNTYDGKADVTVITNEKIVWSMGIDLATKTQNNPDISRKP